MRDALPAFDGGTILIGDPRPAVQVPARAVRGRVPAARPARRARAPRATEIRVIAPMSAPVPGHARGLAALPRRARGARDRVHGAEPRRRADPAAKEAVLESGERLPYDLFVGIPIHRVPAVVAESGLAEHGWVAVDRDTLLTPFPDVYAVGDVAGIPMAKAGVFAENAAGVVADHILARLRGEEPWAALRGRGQLLHRVRRRASREGRGELPRRSCPDGDGRRPVRGSRSRQEGVRLDPARALVRHVSGVAADLHHSSRGRASPGNGDVAVHRHRGLDTTAARARAGAVRRGARRAPADRARGGGGARRCRGRHAGRRVLHRVPDGRRSGCSRADGARRARRGSDPRAHGPAHGHPDA